MFQMEEVSNRIVVTLIAVFIFVNAIQFVSDFAEVPPEAITGKVAVALASVCVTTNGSIIPVENQTIYTGTPFFLDINCTPDSSNFVFDDTFPIFNITNAGFINFTPNETDVGIYDKYIILKDSCGGILDEFLMRFIVMTSNRAPVLDSISDQSINQNDEFSYDANATDPDGDPITFGDNSTFFNIDPDTGLISFTPIQNDVGNNSVLIYVFDDKNAMDSQVVNFEIHDVNDAPVLDRIGAQTATINYTYFYDVNATDVDTTLPHTLTFSDNTTVFDIDPYSGIINFTPADDQNGTYWVNITVTDGYLWDYEVISFTVAPENHPPNITWWDPANYETEMYEGESLTFSISATDPDGTVPSAQWYVDSGSLTNANSYNYSYYAQSGSYGYHNLTVVISDGELTDYHEWEVLVKRRTTQQQSSGGGSSAEVPFVPKVPCMENWRCGEWSVCSVDGFQIRRCRDINKCGTSYFKPNTTRNCTYYPQPSCEDGIQNCHHGGCEILVDCGGPCPPCPTCSDNIQNQGEEGIDCGGPCPPCVEMQRPVKGEDKKKPLCGNGICNKGELFTCINDCSGQLTELIMVILVITLILLISYRYNESFMVSMMKFRRVFLLAVGRKAGPVLTSRERTGTYTLIELHKLREGLVAENVNETFDKLAEVMRKFFSKSVRMGGEFTYIDLNESINKTKMKSDVKKKISNFSVSMTKMEYSGYEVSMAEVANMLNLAMTIVEAMTKISIDKALKIDHEMNSRTKSTEIADKDKKKGNTPSVNMKLYCKRIIEKIKTAISSIKKSGTSTKKETAENDDKKKEAPIVKKHKRTPFFVLDKFKKPKNIDEKDSKSKKMPVADKDVSIDEEKNDKPTADEPLSTKEKEKNELMESEKEKPEDSLQQSDKSSEIPGREISFEDLKKKMTELISEAERLCRLGDYEKAKELYQEARGLYDNVSADRRKELATETVSLIRLYNEIISNL